MLVEAHRDGPLVGLVVRNKEVGAVTDEDPLFVKGTGGKELRHIPVEPVLKGPRSVSFETLRE